MHVSPGAHVVPHAPQFISSIASSASQPLPAMKSQSSKPVAHTQRQLEATHTASAPSGSGHPKPHAPQWSGLELVSTQTPPPQSSSGQVLRHAPPAQYSSASQLVMQSPQKRGSSSVSRQAPSQRSRSPGQLQLPPLQTSPMPQLSVHIPQWSSSVWRSTQAEPHRFGVSPPQDTVQIPPEQTSAGAHTVPGPEQPPQ